MEIVFSLRTDALAIDNALTRWLAQDGVSPGRFQLLVVLWAAMAPVPQRYIVQVLKVTRATVSASVEHLLRQGHVSCAPGVEDGREVFVALTPSGRRFTTRLVKEHAVRLRSYFSHLSPAELTTAADVLHGLVAEQTDV